MPDARAPLLDRTEQIPGDGIVFVASHAGQGRIMNEVIDSAVVEKADPLRTDPELDMYDPANGFHARRRGVVMRSRSSTGSGRRSWTGSGGSTIARGRLSRMLVTRVKPAKATCSKRYRLPRSEIFRGARS